MPEANTLALLFIAALNALTAWLAMRTHNEAVATRGLTESTARDVVEVKKATDGMTSALVKATGEAALAQGKVQGRADEKAEVAVGTAAVVAEKSKS